MAVLFNGNGIDTDQVEDDREVLPAGDYLVRITGSEVKPTKAGTGVMLILEMTVEDGHFAGRKFWQNLNIQNQNAVAQKIGQQTLKRIVQATGAPSQVSDSNQLHGLMFMATTKVETDGWGDKVILKGIKSYTNPVPPQQQAGRVATGGSPKQQPAQGQATQQAPADAGMPWNQ
jgi:hypothetical protein